MSLISISILSSHQYLRFTCGLFPDRSTACSTTDAFHVHFVFEEDNFKSHPPYCAAHTISCINNGPLKHANC